MGEVLEATVKTELRKARRELAEADRNYMSLKNKESEFAQDILAWVEIKRKIVKVLEDSKLNL